MSCSISCRTLYSPPATSCQRMRGYWTWGLGPSHWENARGKRKNLPDLSLIAKCGDVFFCSEALASFRRHIFQLVVSGFESPMQLLKDEVDRFWGLAVYVRDGLSAYRQRSCKCRCCKVIVVRIYSSSNNFHVFGIYRNPDLSDKILGCLLTTIGKVQSVDSKRSLLFVVEV